MTRRVQKALPTVHFKGTEKQNNMDIFFVQLFLGVGLFFLINWIGKHSYSIGYMEISIFTKAEEAPALNFLIRVLSPIVYIIIVSTILYNFGLEKYVSNIYLVNIYYILFRLFFNLITYRGLLLNWNKQALYWTTIVIISFFVYQKLIKEKRNILPDFTTVANELWIIILIFIFQVINNLHSSNQAILKRKDIYLRSRYSYFNKRYGQLIKSILKNEILESMVYAIIIYEDFNRPLIARKIENLKFRITRTPHTLGIMQVRSEKIISDLESIRLGTGKVLEAYEAYLKKSKETVDGFCEWQAQNFIINDYNRGESYLTEVKDLAEKIKNTFYKETSDSLEPNK